VMAIYMNIYYLYYIYIYIYIYISSYLLAVRDCAVMEIYMNIYIHNNKYTLRHDVPVGGEGLVCDGGGGESSDHERQLSQALLQGTHTRLQH
jgi:hypothetical protein